MTTSGSFDRETYLMMVKGLEQMANLYKHAEQPSGWERFRRIVRRDGPACVITFAEKLWIKCRRAIAEWLKRAGQAFHVSRRRPAAFLKSMRDRKYHRVTKSSAANCKRAGLSYEGDRYFRDGRIAVYMAMFGSYDRIPEPLIRPDNIDYYVLTEKPMASDSLWKPMDLERCLPEDLADNPIIRNRWCKMHPHLLFPEYEASIYLDSNIMVVSDLTPFVSFTDAFPVAMFRHWQRDCVYREAQACRDAGRDTRENLDRHEKRLRALGIPEHWGLLEAPVIARLHHDPRCIALMEAWWENFLSGSRRDQLSLIETLWQKQLLPEQIGTLGENIYGCNLLVKTSHRLQVRRR